MLSKQKVFVLFLRQGLYVAQVGLKLWTSYISVFTSPVLGYRLIQPHLSYGVLGSQSRTSYRLGQALYSLNYVPSFPEMCVCMRVVCVHVCVTELQSQPQRMGQEIDCYLYTFLNMCGDQRSACLPHLLSSFLLRQSLQLHPKLLFGSFCLQEFCLYLSSTRITDWLRYLLGFYVGARYLNSRSSQLRGKTFYPLSITVSPKDVCKAAVLFFLTVYSQRKGIGPGVLLQDDHTVNPNIAIYWKNLFLIVV